jgi:choline dehydrogenase
MMKTILSLHTQTIFLSCLAVIMMHLPIDLCAHNNAQRKCYDYIVIGSSAGAVVAKKLTDDKKTSVLLLEAGDSINEDPVLVDSKKAPEAYLLLNQEVMFQGRNAIQPQLNGGYFSFGNASILGGGSSIGGEQVVFGSPAYWKKVQEVAGDEWCPKKVFKRYKELESFVTTASEKSPGKSRGCKGPWKNAAVPSCLSHDAESLLKGLETISGMSQIDDYNDPVTPVGPFGMWNMQQQYDRPGFPRESTAVAFLGPKVISPNGIGVKERKLRLLVRATALSLIWDKECPDKVIGVRYCHEGECFEVFAKEEVILAAGLLSAPFLQRNGIGPDAVLSAAGVETRIPNDHVGKHLMNHVGVPIIFHAEGINLQTQGEPWAFFAPGAFLPAELPVSHVDDLKREIQWNIIDLSPYGAAGFVQVFPVLLTPKSEGSINIQNNDPLTIPAVDNGYLSNGEDRDMLLKTISKSIKDLADYYESASYDKPLRLVTPTRDTINDPIALNNYINKNLAQSFNYTSTARMGENGTCSVVDCHGKVHGVKGLRVADASILPLIPDGNTCTPAILVGWTIAEFINSEKKHLKKNH